MKRRVKRKSSSKKSVTFNGIFTFVVIIAILVVSGVGLSMLFHIPFAHSASYPELVSVASDGTSGDASSSVDAISSGGRYVVFDSSASNLVSGTTALGNVFVRDRQTGQTQLVSVSSDGTPGNSDSIGGSVSDDGRYVAFFSSATNLASGATSGNNEIYVHDRQTGQTQLVSVASDGTEANGISVNPFISGDGEYVAFTSQATNLVPGVTSGNSEVYIHDMNTDQTQLVSTAQDGTEGNGASGGGLTISSDGRYAVFSSQATNLVPGVTSGTHVYWHDRNTGQTEVEDVSSQGVLGNSNYNTYGKHVLVSNDGRYIAFDSLASNLVPNDTNGNSDVFVRDRQAGTTIQADVASDGTQAINEGLKPFGMSMSRDGRYVAFSSIASNLINNDINNLQDVFVHDVQTGQTKIVSLTSDGSQYTLNCYKCGGFPFNTREATISPDGNYVAFDSNGGNFIPGINNSQIYNTYFAINPFVSAVPVISVGPITAAPNPVQVNSATTVTVTFTSNDSPDTAVWNWGDGSTNQNGTVTENNGSGTVSDSHTYANPGSYTIQLTVRGNSGLQSSSSAVVAVAPAGGFTGNVKGDNYSGANLNNQNLSGGNLMGSTFIGTTFQNANLSGVNGKSVDFTSADFTGANLSHANFMGSNFTGAKFTNATFLGSQFKNATMTNVKYSNTICPNGTNSDNDGGTCAGQGGGL